MTLRRAGGPTESVEVDTEVLYIGTILHDVGLATRFDGPERFEMRGADVVRTMLLEAGMQTARAESVWDVIALRASTAIAAHKSIETRIANRGISIDVRGVGAEHLPEGAVQAELDTWPRQQFPAAFAETLIDEVRAHPASVRSSSMECIAVAHVPGFEPTDSCDAGAVDIGLDIGESSTPSSPVQNTKHLRAGTARRCPMGRRCKARLL